MKNHIYFFDKNIWIEIILDPNIPKVDIHDAYNIGKYFRRKPFIGNRMTGKGYTPSRDEILNHGRSLGII